jgi:hypothetical protein
MMNFLRGATSVCWTFGTGKNIHATRANGRAGRSRKRNLYACGCDQTGTGHVAFLRERNSELGTSLAMDAARSCCEILISRLALLLEPVLARVKKVQWARSAFAATLRAQQLCGHQKCQILLQNDLWRKTGRYQKF